MKKILALLLSLLMLLSIFPSLPVFAAETKSAEGEDIWAEITALEESKLAKRGIKSNPTADDFAALSEDVEKLVVSSSSFQPGTISRHGDFFFWEDVDGNAYGYSPRLRERMYAETVNADADPEALSAVETTSYAVRGGSPDSANVAVFQPYYGIDSSFSTQYANEGKDVARALGGTNTTYKTTSATIDQVAQALQTCAVVFFDSHGDTDYYVAGSDDFVTKANSSYLCMQTDAGWTTEDKKAVTGPYGTYYHCWYGGSNGNMEYYMVDGTGFANHMTGSACNNFLWMAICLGMATDGLWKPLHAKGVEVVYGYSQSVSFDGDYDYEADFWDKMIAGENVKTAFAYMTRNYKWDPAYAADKDYDTIGEARFNYVAFPNVVSSEDTYQGHRTKNPTSATAANSTAYDANYGACNLQTVNSSWTLYTQYAITAVSNNEAWGTVSVSGSTITASPKEGYYAAGCEVTQGSATVTQNGNIFTVSAASDCTVRIDFAAKTPATVTFVTPDGVSVSASSVSTYVGDEIQLPTTSGTPTADAQEYRFLGWTLSSLTDATTRPDYAAAGSKVTVNSTDTVYYAIYTYTIADGSASADFAKVVDEPESWAGDFILTYNGSVVFDASGKYTGSALGGTGAAIAFESTGMTLADDKILDAKDDYVYVLEPSTVTSGAYTIRMKGSNYYLSYSGSSNSITTTTSPATASAQWNLSFNGSTVSIQNAATPERYLQYNTSGKVFRCYLNSQKNLTLFAGVSGTTYYTTVLSSAVVCEHDYQSVVTDPTCTEKGFTTHTCSKCGNSYVDNYVDALGHNYAAAVTAPTCTEAGYTTYTCSRCHDSYTADETAALGHNFENGVCTVCGEADPDYKPAENPFEDVAEDDWFATAVLWATSQNPPITSGTDATHFSPSNKCTRAEIVQFLWNAAGKPAPAADAENPFDDVSSDDWFYNAVLWAVGQKITSGTTPTTFAPSKRCSRAEVVQFLWNAAGNPAAIEAGDNELPVNTQLAFTDVKADDWFYNAVEWAVANGITSGTTPTTFAPAKSCTRAEVVQFLYKAS